MLPGAWVMQNSGRTCAMTACGVTPHAQNTGISSAATGTASVVLFGPTAPRHWGPRGPAPHVALWAGGVGDPHADVPHEGLLLITVARVLAATRQILKEAA